MGLQSVIERRRHEREELLDRARAFTNQLGPELGVRAVVVYGSVARGDFNIWSDVDVVVVADHLPVRSIDRWGVLGDRPGGVEPLAWTPAEWLGQVDRGNPIATEAIESGVWLRGSPADVSAAIRPTF
ncbi:MAG: nucleotidyltransferase domain-containing protein [Actinobacteria bacterium]|nr:nucleotidyltransferase domain-containing protein [Actinomycetota bacterium]